MREAVVVCGAEDGDRREPPTGPRRLMEAMDAELIVRNPAARVRLPKKPKRHTPTVLTPKEIGALAREVPPHWRALVLVDAYGAMR